MATRPSRSLLRNLRSHVGRINTCAHTAIASLDGTSEDLAAVVDHVQELRHVSKEIAAITVTVLLQASHDRRAVVRAAAASAMSVHPYGALRDRLAELMSDGAAVVQEAALRALDEMRALQPACLSCGSDSYDVKQALKLPESSDPHAPHVEWPVFCSRECAVTYALDDVRGLVDS